VQKDIDEEVIDNVTEVLQDRFKTALEGFMVLAISRINKKV